MSKMFREFLQYLLHNLQDDELRAFIPLVSFESSIEDMYVFELPKCDFMIMITLAVKHDVREHILW